MHLPHRKDFKAVLFDLDGTLVDTAPDMAWAINQVLKDHQLMPLTFAQIRPHVSAGSRGLVELAFNKDAANMAENERLSLQQAFLDHYAQHLCVETQVFAGFEAALHIIEQQSTNIKTWGIVTNKPGWLAEPLIQQLGLARRSACLVSGDTLPHRKPHPAPLLHACQLIDVAPEHCLYFGDDERDIQAANACQMPSAIAAFGYLRQESALAKWPTDYYIDKPADLLTWLNSK